MKDGPALPKRPATARQHEQISAHAPKILDKIAIYFSQMNTLFAEHFILLMLRIFLLSFISELNRLLNVLARNVPVSFTWQGVLRNAQDDQEPAEG
jgi:hypothetical protein